MKWAHLLLLEFLLTTSTAPDPNHFLFFIFLFHKKGSPCSLSLSLSPRKKFNQIAISLVSPKFKISPLSNGYISLSFSLLFFVSFDLAILPKINPFLLCESSLLFSLWVTGAMKHFMLPKNAVLREAHSNDSPSPSSYSSSPNPNSSKSKPPRRHKSAKENAPPSDLNSLPLPDHKASPATTKMKSPLPPRPPNSLKRKLVMDTAPENAVTGVYDSGVKVIFQNLKCFLLVRVMGKRGGSFEHKRIEVEALSTFYLVI